METLSKYLSKENLVRYSVLELTVIGAQQLATRGCTTKKGWKYWVRLVGGTTLGLVGGNYLGEIAATFVPSNVNSNSSAKEASVSKESDVSGL